MRDIALFVMDFFALFSSKKIEDLFFLRILPIFDSSGGLKVFISQNKVKSFFVDHLILGNFFAPHRQS